MRRRHPTVKSGTRLQERLFHREPAPLAKGEIGVEHTTKWKTQRGTDGQQTVDQ